MDANERANSRRLGFLSFRKLVAGIGSVKSNVLAGLHRQRPVRRIFQMELFRCWYEHETNLFHSFRLWMFVFGGSFLVILPKKKSQSRRKAENSASCTSGVYGDFSVSLCLF